MSIRLPVRNRLGISDQAELHRVEATFAAVRSYELAVNPVPGDFDLAHLQQIRRRLFGDVYDWAGQLRTVDISKGTTHFASHEQIAGYAPQITRPLARDQRQQGLSPERFSSRAGHYLGELNMLHPSSCFWPQTALSDRSITTRCGRSNVVEQSLICSRMILRHVS